MRGKANVRHYWETIITGVEAKACRRCRNAAPRSGDTNGNGKPLSACGISDFSDQPSRLCITLTFFAVFVDQASGSVVLMRCADIRAAVIVRTFHGYPSRSQIGDCVECTKHYSNDGKYV